MTTTPESPSWLTADTKLAAQEIQAALGLETSNDQDEKLRITGLEPLILGIALKAVIGAATSLSSKILYDKWKSAHSRDDLDKIIKELSRGTKGGARQPADAKAAREDVISSLTLEGLTRGQAEKVCDAIFKRMQNHTL
jgi:hypothetical protein